MAETTYLVSLNASTGAFTAIRCKSLFKIRSMVVIEDGSGAAAGLIYQYNDGSSTPFQNNFQLPAGGEPIIFGTNPFSGAEAGYGRVIGEPASSDGNRVASLICNLKSAGAATVVRITEFP
jgi:hypothetical protein